MAQGDDALARGDYEQALLIGNRIVSQDPRNLTGYRLALICCVMKNWEMGFQKIIEDAKMGCVPLHTVNFSDNSEETPIRH